MYNIIISCFSLHRIALLHNTDAVSVLRENGFLEVYAIKKLIKKLCSGISVGCVAFVAIIFIFPLFEGGANAFFRQKTGEGWQQLAAYCIIIATGFSVPTMIYESSRLSFRLKILIHLTAGAFLGVDRYKARRRSPVSPYLIDHRRFPRAPCLSFRQTASEVNKNNDPNPFP